MHLFYTLEIYIAPFSVSQKLSSEGVSSCLGYGDFVKHRQAGGAVSGACALVFYDYAVNQEEDKHDLCKMKTIPI